MSHPRPGWQSASLRTQQRILLTLVLAAPLMLMAQSSGGSYALTRQLIASGGSRAVNGGAILTGSIGQSATAVATGGSFELSGGFHVRASGDPLPDALFRNGFEN